jgi:polysaccharide biosynthesis/export protein
VLELERVRWLLLLVLVVVLSGCARRGAYVWASDVPPAAANEEAQLRVGDKVQVVVYGQDTMSGEFEVRQTGELVTPVVGRITAAGLTTDNLARQIASRLSGVLAKPTVSVVLNARRAIGVTVVGEVAHPGRYDLKEPSTVLEALGQAGGLTEFADRDELYVLRRVSGRVIRVRFRYGDLAVAAPASINFRLREGDIVLAD